MVATLNNQNDVAMCQRRSQIHRTSSARTRKKIASCQWVRPCDLARPRAARALAHERSPLKDNKMLSVSQRPQSDDKRVPGDTRYDAARLSIDAIKKAKQIHDYLARSH